MRDWLRELKNFFRKGDMILLSLCLITSAYSSLIIASATNASKFGGSTRYIIIHIAATMLGLLAYAVMSSINLDFLSEHRAVLAVMNVGMLLLLIPFGTDAGTGNRSWLDFPFLPVNIQPAEICKIFYIIIMASVMGSRQNRISSVPSVLWMAGHLILLVAANMVLSRDLGVTLIFVFIFLGMAFAGGVNLIWFLLGGVGIAAAFPLLWQYYMDDYQKERILYILQPEVIDPKGLGVGWHTSQSLQSLTGGGMLGQGLFNGNRTQAGALYAQHTDYVFSSIGEELGYVGCFLVILLLVLIVIRCVWVGNHSSDYMRRMVCFGAAAAMIFQVCINVGMCVGLVPVIGLTLPLFSYGGSSIVTIYAMLGLVSGVHARPAPTSHERYIRAPRY